MKYDIPAALQALKPGAEWVLRGDQWSGLEWLDKKQAVPTERKKSLIKSQNLTQPKE